MSETTTQTNGVTSQYVAQVTGDLERNLKEQDRVAGEIAALQEQLASLEKDRTVLLNVRQALGVESAPAAPASATPATPAPAVEETSVAAPAAEDASDEKASGEKAAAVPAPRKKTSAGASRRSKAAKPAAAAPKPAVKKAAPRKPAPKAAPKTAPKADQPSLVSLVRAHLAGLSEPRSAAEVAQSLGERYPGRGIKTTVVRSTLEGLVAKNHAQRTKQGSSVFYTSPEAPAAPAANAEEAPREERSA
ncbi:hypothetical protein ACIRPQ_14130 [Streptomyces sp. NPDC101213]|uniref:hypothetical protein n=1 Tax=Streptomyces sp. NPDC101213 TaxID=3366130 RepID=UPI0037FD6EA5